MVHAWAVDKLRVALAFISDQFAHQFLIELGAVIVVSLVQSLRKAREQASISAMSFNTCLRQLLECVLLLRWHDTGHLGRIFCATIIEGLHLSLLPIIVDEVVASLTAATNRINVLLKCAALEEHYLGVPLLRAFEPL